MGDTIVLDLLVSVSGDGRRKIVDYAGKPEEKKYRARQNVVVEMGFARLRRFRLSVKWRAGVLR
jgi:hypothetical protein